MDVNVFEVVPDCLILQVQRKYVFTLLPVIFLYWNYPLHVSLSTFHSQHPHRACKPIHLSPPHTANTYFLLPISSKLNNFSVFPPIFLCCFRGITTNFARSNQQMNFLFSLCTEDNSAFAPLAKLKAYQKILVFANTLKLEFHISSSTHTY